MATRTSPAVQLGAHPCQQALTCRRRVDIVTSTGVATFEVCMADEHPLVVKSPDGAAKTAEFSASK